MQNPTIRRAKLLLFSSLLLVLSLLLTSCADLVLPTVSKEPVTVDDFFVQIENTESAGQTITDMSGMIGIPQKISGDVIITEEETDGYPNVRLYNLSTGELLRLIDDGHEVGFVSDHLRNPEAAAGIFYMVHNDIIYVCNDDGSEAISAYYGCGEAGRSAHGENVWPAQTEGLFFDSLNGFSFNGVNYFVRDGAIVYGGNEPLESNYLNASVEYNGLFYYVDEDMIFVFDGAGALLYDYRLPSYAGYSNIFVLNNGNVFIQYIYAAVEGEEYDAVFETKRYKLVSILANPVKKTETEPILSYLVTDLQNAFSDEDFYATYTQKVTNLATIFEIKNNRFDENTLPRTVVLSDNLIELFSTEDILTGAHSFRRVSYDRYLTHTLAGSLLVTGNGITVGHLNNYRCITEKFILTSDTLYDHDLKPIFVLFDEGYNYYGTVGNNVILSRIVDEEAQLYLFSEGEPALIGKASDFLSCFEGYAMKEADGRYHYYNENAEELIVTDGVIQWIYDKTEKGISNHVGYIEDGEGSIHYYRLSFTELVTIE